MFNPPATVIFAFQVTSISIQHKAVGGVTNSVRSNLEFAVDDSCQRIVNGFRGIEQESLTGIIRIRGQEAGSTGTQGTVGQNLEGCYRKFIGDIGSLGQVMIQVFV